MLRTCVALALVAIAAVACGGESGHRLEGRTGVVQEDALVHVHGLGVVDGEVLIATHTGMWSAEPGQRTAMRRGESRQDVMGFTALRRDRVLGSGHPDLGQGGPPHVGLIESGDLGETWRTVSLRGEADFHALTASGNTVYGFDGLTGRLLVSADGGRRWTERRAPGAIISMAADPKDEGSVAALAGDGSLWSSDDAARSWRRASTQRPGLLAWTREGRLYSVGADGRIHATDDDAASWERLATVGARPSAVAADARGDLYIAVGEGTVLQASNGGRRLRVRVAGAAT